MKHQQDTLHYDTDCGAVSSPDVAKKRKEVVGRLTAEMK
jgi:hypothetical protein